MLLTGTFARSVDEKQRIAIPKRIRDMLAPDPASALYIAPGTDGSLALYTEAAFMKLAERLGQASPTGAEVRAFSRLFYAQAQRVELDQQGRVRVPGELAALAQLGSEAVLIGVQDHLELWDKQRWEEYLTRQQGQFDQIAEAAFRPSV